MARVSGQASLAAAPEAVWEQVTDPRQLSQWWPKVVRVELDGAGAFTEVLTTDKGRDVRADTYAKVWGGGWPAVAAVWGLRCRVQLFLARRCRQQRPSGTRLAPVTRAFP